MARFYVAIVERGASGFAVFFPDIPGCTSAGDTVQEAAENAGEALQGHLTLALENYEVVPDATPIDAIECDADVDEAARVLVRSIPTSLS